MRLLKRLLFALIGLVVALGLGGFLLPKSAHVERSTMIAAPAPAIYPYVSQYALMNQWSPWARLDPNTQYSYSGPNGVGSRMEWVSEHPDVGSGSQEILELRPDDYVKVALDFGDMGTATAYYQLTPVDTGTEVTWAFDSTFGNNIPMRYFGLMLDKWVGADYEKGLNNLKLLVESGGAEGG